MAFYFSTEDFLYKDYLWKVMSFDQGSDQKILNKLFDQLTYMLQRYSKVFVVRFDLRICIDVKDNQLISKFRKKLNRILERKYKCIIGYAWAREQSSESNTPHYHYALLLNGHRTNKAFAYVKIIDEVCNSLLFVSPYYPKNNGYMVYRNDSKSIQRVVYRLSYLAKHETKSDNPKGISSYQTSRIKSLYE